MKQCLRTLQYTPGQSQQKLNQFLAAYRRAPHGTTGVSPALLFLKRELYTPLNFSHSDTPKKVEEQRSKFFEDPSFQEGDTVAVRDFVNPLKKWRLGTIVARDGQLQYTVMVDGDLHRKHIEHLRKVGSNVQLPTAVTYTLPASPNLSTTKTMTTEKAATSAEEVSIPLESSLPATQQSPSTPVRAQPTPKKSTPPTSLAAGRPRRQVRRPVRFSP